MAKQPFRSFLQETKWKVQSANAHDHENLHVHRYSTVLSQSVDSLSSCLHEPDQVKCSQLTSYDVVDPLPLVQYVVRLTANKQYNYPLTARTRVSCTQFRLPYR